MVNDKVQDRNSKAMCKAGVSKKFLMSHESFFVILNLLDYLTTHILITGDGEELMPAGAWVIAEAGMPGLLLFKLGLTAALLTIFRRFKPSDSMWSLLNGALTGVILWNTLGVLLGCLHDAGYLFF